MVVILAVELLYPVLSNMNMVEFRICVLIVPYKSMINTSPIIPDSLLSDSLFLLFFFYFFILPLQINTRFSRSKTNSPSHLSTTSHC